MKKFFIDCGETYPDYRFKEKPFCEDDNMSYTASDAKCNWMKKTAEEYAKLQKFLEQLDEDKPCQAD